MTASISSFPVEKTRPPVHLLTRRIGVLRALQELEQAHHDYAVWLARRTVKRKAERISKTLAGYQP